MSDERDPAGPDQPPSADPTQPVLPEPGESSTQPQGESVNVSAGPEAAEPESVPAEPVAVDPTSDPVSEPATEPVNEPVNEPVAAESVWDPWAPPGRETADHTQTVDLSHTQELGSYQQSQPTSVANDPAWAAEPTGWPGEAPGQQPAAESPHAAFAASPTGYPVAPAGHPVDPAGHPAGSPGQAAYPGPRDSAAQVGEGWDPISSQAADAGYAGQPAPWVGHRPPDASAPQQKGPGWGALVAVAAVAALIAAGLGGVFGGWLGATGRVDFGPLDRTPSSIPSAGAGATSRPEGSIANIAAKALPSVVTIKVDGADGAGTGSGFVLDRDGHIITNNHVVASAASSGTIKVELSDGTEIDAKIAGRDTSYDLAVLKTSRTDLVPLVMGSSKDVVVGDQVIAVGAPLGLESSVTSGIVSALNRPVSPGGDGNTQSFINAIQTDAAINPGNSGGPLLDMQGHVIGINSAIARIPGAATDTQLGNIGVGFAIPSDQVVKTAEQLIKTGTASHPVIGVVLDREFTGDGVRILPKASSDSGPPVDPKGPAGKAGIQAGDIIIEFDGRRVTDPDDLVVAIRAKSVGDDVSMKVRRGTKTISVTLTLSGSDK
jgi:putative serine protease PepD